MYLKKVQDNTNDTEDIKLPLSWLIYSPSNILLHKIWKRTDNNSPAFHKVTKWLAGGNGGLGWLWLCQKQLRIDLLWFPGSAETEDNGRDGMRVRDETWGGDTGQVHQVRFGSSQICKLGRVWLSCGHVPHLQKGTYWVLINIVRTFIFNHVFKIYCKLLCPLFFGSDNYFPNTQQNF